MSQAVLEDDVVADLDESQVDDGASTEAEGVADETSDESTEGEGGSADDAVVVTIGDEAPAQEEDESRAPAWVRDLRKQNREKDRALRAKDEEIARLKGSPSQPVAVVVGAEPTFEGCEYDPEKYKAELVAWNGRKQAAEAQAEKKRKADEASQESWKKTLATYDTQKSTLKVSDYEDAEGVARDALNVTQQGVILSGTDNAALVIYALGKNPKVLKELSAITDPVKFAVRIGKLEKDLKVTPRKAAPIPERVVRGNAAGSSAVDNTLERLRAEADKTGDRTKVAKYMKDKAKAA